MPFKTLLTVTGPDLGDGDLALAARLAESLGAHLSVLVVEMAMPMPVADYAGFATEGWLAERRAEERRLLERRESVTAFVAAETISGDVITAFPELAWSDEAIGQRGRYADLILAGPDVLADATLRDKVIEGALFSAGKPVLLLPTGAPATLAPKRVVIGWDARIEAARAMAAAVEILKEAEDVRLVLVDPVEAEGGHGAEPGADAAAYLARHGVKVTVERLPSEGHGVSQVLTRFARDFDAELLVMGGYGHSRLRERLFGGVTRSMLDAPPLPIFMAR